MQSWILIVTAAVLYVDFALLLRLGVFCEAISVAIGYVPSMELSNLTVANLNQ